LFLGLPEAVVFGYIFVNPFVALPATVTSWSIVIQAPAV
jgi:hypothetical protein